MHESTAFSIMSNMVTMIRQTQNTTGCQNKKQKTTKKQKTPSNWKESISYEEHSIWSGLGKETKKWDTENEKRIIYLYSCLPLARYVFPYNSLQIIKLKNEPSAVLFKKWC